MHVEILPVTAFSQNCTVIWDDDKNAVIIDPGGEAPRLIKFIEEQGLKLNKILLTHGHLDHVGAAKKLQDHFNVEMIGPHVEDQFLFDSLPEQSARFGLPEIAPFLPDRWLNEGEQVTLGELIFDVLHLPGHTPGHIGFIEKSKNVGFTGDVLFHGSVGRTDFPRSSHADLINAIKTKLFAFDDDMIIIPGHGPATNIGRERKLNPFVQ
ncbi:MBL fold metallo-hydrolase [Pasteurellaceae bacterium 20609_3]|uniref:MBL fold metallo-hydrolase n=1 Tax=Spirabiliibacterium mucosae TaxID=28156 RepID=UPI001AADE6B9|nr:MBL fold metallo-hydrolase [Spirabiliibacterium mucosae]MBE2898690.1 MBL fold metallo-hydrolase [Spirabiliibacterium mucosae]